MGDLDAVIDAVPQLAAGAVARLPGGLTNTNYRVDTPHGSFVVRVFGEGSSLLAIDRDNEHHNSLSAAQAGVGARVVAYLPLQRAMVMEWIEGETLGAGELRAGGPLLEEVASACRRLHGARRFRDDFDMFAIQEGYLAIVRERGFRLPARYAEFAPHAAAIREALAVAPEPTVPCHNDLLAENIMRTPAGLRLIDYEYSGNNEPSFELGNLASESGLGDAELEQLVSAYYGRSDPALLARARLWSLMARYGWTLWASIQDGVSELDFDFWAWGIEKYESAVAEFDGGEFEQLLTAAARGAARRG